MLKREEQSGLKAMSLALSPLGLAAWYLISGVQDFSARQYNGLAGDFENRLLSLAGALSLLAAVLLATAAVRASYSLLVTVLLLGVVLVVIELGAFVIIHSDNPLGASVDLKAALVVHSFLACTIYRHLEAQVCLEKVLNN